MANEKEIVLYAITGLSPAVLTETVWGLANKEPAIVPDRVVVFTTTDGKEKLVDFCFSPKGSRWKEVVTAIAKKTKCKNIKDKLKFSEGNIEVIKDESGKAFKDISDDESNEKMIEFFFGRMKPVYFDPNTMCIASIAGGRKSMGAALHAVASVLGRADDKICHVLINDEVARKNKDFAFPGCKLKGGKSISQEEANLKLAEIPFIGMGELLKKAKIDTTRKFKSIVATLKGKCSIAKVKLICKRGGGKLIIEKNGGESMSFDIKSNDVGEYLEEAYSSTDGKCPKLGEDKNRLYLRRLRALLEDEFSKLEIDAVIPYEGKLQTISKDKIEIIGTYKQEREKNEK